MDAHGNMAVHRSVPAASLAASAAQALRDLMHARMGDSKLAKLGELAVFSVTALGVWLTFVKVRKTDPAKAPQQTGAEPSPLDFYDAVLSISSLEDVYKPDRGWPVQVTQQRNFNFGAEQDGVRVIPVGQFNSGKTWLISQLCGVELPRGVSVHTEGISIKEATMDKFKVVLLDTVGSNSPMDALPNGAQARSASSGVETVLQELRAQEDFYRQVCFELGQVILFVVGQMSHKDQADLVRLARSIRKDRARKDIVVVHNLREWDMAMLLRKSAKDGLSYPDRTKALFDLKDESLEVAVGMEKGMVIRHSGLFQGEGGDQRMPVNVHHYYLTDSRLPCSLNKFAIQDMWTTITRNISANRKSLAEDIAAAATKVQGHFASFVAGEPKIIFDPEQSRFRTEDPLPADAPYRMKPRDLGSYFTIGSDDPAYNIMLVPGEVKRKQSRGSVEEMQDGKAYQVLLELPGLCEESLQDIRKLLKSKDNSRALRREPLQGESGEVWVISFQVKLVNVPVEMYNKVKEESANEIVLEKDIRKHAPKESGSRNHFNEGIRTVKVTLRTSIMDYDTSQDPVVTYVDGVLGITLMKDARG